MTINGQSSCSCIRLVQSALNNRYRPSFHLACLFSIKRKKEKCQGSGKLDSSRPRRNGCTKIEVVWPYDSSLTRPVMWVDFVVGSCFALREMSGVVVLKSLGGRFIFGRAYQWRGEGRYRKEALRFKCLVVFLLREEVFGLKKFTYVQKYRKVKTSKHQDRKQSSFNGHHQCHDFQQYPEQGLYHLPNSGRTLSLSLRALKP